MLHTKYDVDRIPQKQHIRIHQYKVVEKGNIEPENVFMLKSSDDKFTHNSMQTTRPFSIRNNEHANILAS